MRLANLASPAQNMSLQRGFKFDHWHQITDFTRFDINRWSCFELTGNSHQPLNHFQVRALQEPLNFVHLFRGKNFSDVLEVRMLT